MKTTEITHGANGWHVHLHVLAFLDQDVSNERFEAHSGRMISRWVDCVDKRGGSALVGVQDARLTDGAGAEMAAYLTKATFDPDEIALELTRSDLKTGAGRSPFQILDDAIEGHGDTARDWALWHEYERASWRKRQQTWSQGLRELLRMLPPRSDEEIAADEDLDDAEADAVLLLWLTKESWQIIRRNDGLYWGLLDAAMEGQAAAVRWLDTRNLEWKPPSRPESEYGTWSA
jgi:hypothetical protein